MRYRVPDPKGELDVPYPDGKCWCGCGETTGRGSYFRQGTDRRAEKWLMRLHYGEVVEMLWSHGYGPGRKNVRQTAIDSRVFE